MYLYCSQNFRSIGQVSKAVTSLNAIREVSVSNSDQHEEILQQRHLSFVAAHKTKAETVSQGIGKKLLAFHLTMFSVSQNL
jgi:cellobiose-specific phosphotransferase system component IIA